MKKKWMLLLVCLMVALATDLPARAASDDGRKVVTVAFGIGLNTAQPGNAANHHVLPKTIRVKKGGVVNFVVAGLHQIFVYRPGIAKDDIVIPAGDPFLINFDVANLYYRGIITAGGPPGTAPSINPSNAANRVESVSFSEKGKYLVICNVRPHFLDGMFAYVIVGDDDDEDEGN